MSDIIREKNIITLFQPVISLRDKRVVGFEALTRGLCTNTGGIIMPTLLFSAAKEEGNITDLDRLCRKNALAAFKEIPNYENYILFLNLDTTAIEKNDPDVNRITKEYTDEVGLDYSSISLEIVESRIDNEENLADFVEHYRRLGYYVSLDDFGAMHSNMNRIVVSKPDIIKIDMELIRNVHKDYYQQSILSSIISLAHKTGALTLAEGLESPDDIITCYELGIDLYQGFYFFKPCVDIFSNYQFIYAKIDFIVMMIKNRLKENVIIRKNQHLSFDFIMDLLCKGTRSTTIEHFLTFLQMQVSTFDEIERIFMLDEDGQQVYDAVCKVCDEPKSKNSFLMMHEMNADHSLKDYYYYLDKIDSDRFFTDRHLSTVSGRVLRTMSVKININSEKLILCVDFVDSTPSSKQPSALRGTV